MSDAQTPPKMSRRVAKAIREGRNPFPVDTTGHQPKRVVTKRPPNKMALRLQTDPEFKAKFLEAGRKAKLEGRSGRQKGIPYGWRSKDWNALKNHLAPQIDQITDHIWSNYVDIENLTEEAMAKEALRTAVEIMRMPTTKDRLTAAKLILDFTKQKPAEKKDVQINAAEAFLDSILKTTPDS